MKRIYSGVLCLALAALLGASAPARGASPANSLAREASATVDLFEAREAGQIDVKLIPQDSKSGTVVITNNTKGPLTIKLPEAFAGVPVLAQRGRGGGGGVGGNLGGSGGNQGIGGGFGGGGGIGGGGIGGGGGGLFNIAAERASKLKILAVCLEHGKADPSPRVPYELVPIESFTIDPKVIELVKMLGRSEIDQSPAQAAAWHIANGLSWRQLADKIGVKHINGVTESYFSPVVLGRAQQIASEANRRASRAVPNVSSPGEVSLLNRH